MTDEARTTLLHIDEREVSGTLALTGSIVSKFTGTDLRTADFFAPAEDFSEAQIVSSAAREGKSVTDADGTVWRVASASMTSGADGQPQAELDLIELENLEATRIVFPQFSLTPLRYLEQTIGDVILIQVLTGPVDKDNSDQLEAFLDGSGLEAEPVYFSVVREGVSKEPFSVRLGRVLWQDNPEGKSYLVALVSESGDNESLWSGSPQSHDPQLQRVIDHEAQSLARLDRIELALVKAGILDASEVGPPLDKDTAAWSRARRQFNRTVSLDKFF